MKRRTIFTALATAPVLPFLFLRESTSHTSVDALLDKIEKETKIMEVALETQRSLINAESQRLRRQLDSLDIRNDSMVFFDERSKHAVGMYRELEKLK